MIIAPKNSLASTPKNEAMNVNKFPRLGSGQGNLDDRVWASSQVCGSTPVITVIGNPASLLFAINIFNYAEGSAVTLYRLEWH
ncbi:hypothetical protein GGQ96_000151 [Sphingomonas abaci]|uniref:Uncharacterized protein n=1 Tax=Sphingomonas abaci TaxID=237611 RepID=A0A7W7AFE9_9SPHN|nr:hypothetical protein [Sphingomonas abaci]